MELWFAEGTGTSSYHGLQRCGSVWACPVCALKIAEGRRDELVAGMERHKATAGGVQLVTLTFRHARADDLGQLIEKFADAQAQLFRSPAWKVARDIYGIVGRVSALEITHGANGWHPHRHSLVFTDRHLSELELEAMQRLLFSAWRVACESAGLGAPSRLRGVDVRGGHAAGEYVSKFGAESRVKWGAESELARAHTKRGRNDNKTPWDLLRDLHGKKNLQGDEHQAVLFREYAGRFKGRRQLVWTRGLRDRLGLAREKSDAELAEELTARQSRMVAPLPPKVWKAIRRRELRGELLEVCTRTKGDDQAVREWLYDLRIFDGPIEGEGGPPDPDELARRRSKAAALNGPPSPAEDLFGACT